MSKNYWILAFLFFIFLFSNLEVKACTCGYVTPDSSFVDAVFVGTIIKKTSEGFPTKLEVQVSETFRGLENQKTVEILHKNLNCGSTMYENREYLFLVSKDKSTGQLILGPCNYSYKNSGQQRQMIEILRWRKNSNQNGLLVGKVVMYADESNVVKKPNGVDKVFAIDQNGNKFEAVIESDGFYKFSDIIEGNYKVFIELPNHLTTLADLKGYDDEKSVRTTVKIVKNRGNIEDFYVMANGKISGRVFNADGTPAIEANVHLINSDGFIDESTETNESGFYKFEGLPAKQFKLMVGVTWNNYVSLSWKEAFYPTTYFPNVDSRNVSVPIKLAEGEIVENQNITLLPKYKHSVLNGAVFMPDGKPAKNIKISVQIQVKEKDRTLHSAWEDLAETDSNGRFSFEMFENTKYLLKIEFEKDNNSYFADCFLITNGNNRDLLKINLQKGKSECDEKRFGF
jgi:5-hydroxyisourate hydrolase-like protein (transthyretin family)